MGTYDRQVATAERLIREKGKPVQVVRQSTTLPDPDRPWEPGEPVETLTDAHGVFLNFNARDMETMSKMAGASEIQSSDRKVLLAAAAAGAPLTTNDKLRDADGDWSIEWVEVLAPNGENILYTVRARR